MKRWSEEELEELALLADQLTNKQLAVHFGRTQGSVERAINWHEIKRKSRLKPIRYTIDENKCWNCTSHTLVKGYPRIKRKGKIVHVAKFIYEAMYGRVRDGLVVRHVCDNRLCINPEHLTVGTYQDNVNDAIDRQRFPSHKIRTKEDVKVILSLLNVGETNTNIARLFGVDQSVISNIKTGKRHKRLRTP